jgi:hypothetical protein
MNVHSLVDSQSKHVLLADFLGECYAGILVKHGGRTRKVAIGLLIIEITEQASYFNRLANFVGIFHLVITKPSTSIT